MDTQTKHLAGLVAARMNRAVAQSCNAVVLYPPPHRQTAAKAPTLFCYRTTETLNRTGTGGKWVRVPVVKLLYALGVVGADHLEAAAGLLSWGVQMATDAMIAASDSTYEAGQSLYQLAKIETLQVTGVEYNLDLEMPQVEITVTMQHEWLRAPGDVVAITKFVGDLNLDADLTKPIRRDEFPPA